LSNGFLNVSEKTELQFVFNTLRHGMFSAVSSESLKICGNNCERINPERGRKQEVL
jgi:hypothetical protein